MTLRIIDGVAYERKSADNQFNVKVTELGHGHVETVVTRGWYWVEREMTPEAIRMYLEHVEELNVDDARKAERDEINRERAAKRARTRVRHVCKAMGVNTLVTLTYKANQTDLALCKKHLKEFIRRVRRVMPGFRAVAAFERQARGAWHVHMGCEKIAAVVTTGGWHRMKSFDLLRAIWRSVTKEHGGNVDVQRRKQVSQKSAARIAAYISKYIMKAFAEGEKETNRWTKFGEIDEPRVTRLGHVQSMHEAVELVYAFLPGNASIVTSYLSHWHDVFFFVTEPIV